MQKTQKLCAVVVVVVVAVVVVVVSCRHYANPARARELSRICATIRV